MAKKPVQLDEKGYRKFGIRDKVAYAAGDFGCNMSFALKGTVQTFWLVYMMLETGLLSILLLVKRAVGRRSLSRALHWSAGLLALIFVALAVLAIIDFDGFFTVFHKVFFPQGNWMFSSTSLLITMYPEQFWMGMGIIWVVSSLLAGLLFFALGSAIKPRKAATT